MARPLLLRPDNFTPPSRTPWGGTRVATRYKAGVIAAGSSRIVGESWEVSVEPDFPSRLPDGTPLSDVLAADPAPWLGEAAAHGSTGLLVKLLDAADDLSVQIHPADDYAGLRPGESGKPESWYVLEADPGAGLYLGLREGVTEAAMRAALGSGAVASLLSFVEVEPGDFFVIDAGTAHAIGRGITLVEPQRVAPGRRGITYRYFDWNRRYDARGARDPSGQPRPLHVEHALAVTDWDAPRGDALLRRIRRRAGRAAVDGPARVDALCGPDGPTPSEHLRVSRLAGTGHVALPPEPRLRGLVVVAGCVTVGEGDDAVRVERGRSAVLPASTPAPMCRLEGAHAVLASAPASA